MKWILLAALLSSCAMNTKFRLYQTVSTVKHCTGQIIGIVSYTLHEPDYIVEGCGKVAESEIL